MRVWPAIWLAVVVIIGGWWIGSRVSLPTQTLPTSITQTESSGEVDVVAILTDNRIELSLDTHTVDLLGFDFSKSVVVEMGQTRLFPTQVKVISEATHHRKVELLFTKLKIPFTLVIQNLSGVNERKLYFERG